MSHFSYRFLSLRNSSYLYLFSCTIEADVRNFRSRCGNFQGLNRVLECVCCREIDCVVAKNNEAIESEGLAEPPHSTLGSINEDRFIFLLIHTLAASRFLYAPRNCCRFCFDDPALVSSTCEDKRFFLPRAFVSFFTGGLVSKIEGTALYFRRAFIFKPIDFARTDCSSKESVAKWMLHRQLEFIGFTKSDRVFFTTLVHKLAKWGSSGHLWRLTPSLRVLEHPPATHRCDIIVFL